MSLWARGANVQSAASLPHFAHRVCHNSLSRRRRVRFPRRHHNHLVRLYRRRLSSAAAWGGGGGGSVGGHFATLKLAPGADNAREQKWEFNEKTSREQ